MSKVIYMLIAIDRLQFFQNVEKSNKIQLGIMLTRYKHLTLLYS
jgi:hypothetical protein